MIFTYNECIDKYNGMYQIRKTLSEGKNTKIEKRYN